MAKSAGLNLLKELNILCCELLLIVLYLGVWEGELKLCV